jgi:hypothetical protein
MLENVYDQLHTYSDRDSENVELTGSFDYWEDELDNGDNVRANVAVDRRVCRIQYPSSLCRGHN